MNIKTKNEIIVVNLFKRLKWLKLFTNLIYKFWYRELIIQFNESLYYFISVLWILF